MANTHETIADIIAELRKRGECRERSPVVYDYADRLEAAHKREVQNALDTGGFVEASRKNKQVGDCTKLRETISALRTALKEIRNDVLDMVINHKSEDPDSYAHGLCLSIGGACDMALNSTKEFDDGNE